MSATLTMERERHEEPDVLPFALSLAIGLHVAIAWFTPSHVELPEPPAQPMEVDLAPPKAELPKPAPKRVPEALEPAPTVVRPAKAQPRPAAAGRLLTAEPTIVKADAPLDFITDPDGKAYGFGVVSRGGTSTGEGVKAPPAPAIAAVVAAPAAPALAGPGDLSEKPHLLAEDPCRGFYPESASVDSASAVVRVVIEPSGAVRQVTLVSESPSGEGFGAAARQCIRQQRFSAPRDHEGRAVATATTIRVRFDR